MFREIKAAAALTVLVKGKYFCPVFPPKKIAKRNIIDPFCHLVNAFYRRIGIGYGDILQAGKAPCFPAKIKSIACNIIGLPDV